MIGESDVLINKRQALDAICDNCNTERISCDYNPCCRYTALEKLPIVHQTLYGYQFEHLATIATILREEGLPPERVSEALTDIDRIIAIVKAEFEVQLTNSIEHLNTTMKGEQ